MKYMQILIVLLSTSSVWAADLACFTDKPLKTSNGDVSAIVLNNIEKSESDLRSSLPDQGAMTGFELSTDGKVKSAGFSNECDNEYDITFGAAQLDAVIAGKIDSIRGKVKYDGADDIKSEVSMTCRAY
jgi:hypothetical protein